MIFNTKRLKENIRKFTEKPIVIFSASAGGRSALNVLRRYGLKADMFCDSDPEKWGCSLGRLPIVPPDEMYEKFGSTGANIVIGSVTYYTEIETQLLEQGVSPDNIFYVWSLFMVLEHGINSKPFSLSQDEIKKSQQVLLEILKAVHKICEEHEIHYTLFYGTLIGAVRHKGFIPWDDDVDIAMSRKDYNRFLKICKEFLPDEYELISPFEDNNFTYNLHHVMKKNTLCSLRPINTSKPAKLGIKIDILPIDNVFRVNSRIAELQSKISICLRKGSLVKVGVVSFRSIQKDFLSIIAYLIPRKLNFYLLGKINSIVNCFNTDYCAIISQWSNSIPMRERVFHKNVLEERVLMDFEGEKFWAVKDYDAVLKNIYGNYMLLPLKSAREAYRRYGFSFDTSDSR